MSDINFNNIKFKNKRDTLANWTNNNPVLLDGELAIVMDGNDTKIKVGNGSSNFNDLPYVKGDSNINNNKILYGMILNPGTSSSSSNSIISYTADCLKYQPVHLNSDGTFDWGDWADAFFIPKPCMLKYDGTVDYYLDPNDYSKKEDGTASDITNINYDGNAMMEFPLIYYNYQSTTNTFYIANYKADDNFVCYCNLDYEGNIIPNFYMAIYQGYGTGKTRSISGVTPTQRTVQQSIDEAIANNIDSEQVEWYTDVLCDRQLITLLLMLISKRANIQMFGKGYCNTNKYKTGLGNDKGLFYGKSNIGDMVKIFGMENFWGNLARYLAGLKFLEGGSTSSPTTYYLPKFTWTTIDGSSGIGYNNQSNSSYSSCSYEDTSYATIMMSSFSVSANRLFLPTRCSKTSYYNSSYSSTTYYYENSYFGTSFYRTSSAQNNTYLATIGGYYKIGSSNHYISNYYGISGYQKNINTDTVYKGLSCKPHLSKFQNN